MTNLEAVEIDSINLLLFSVTLGDYQIWQTVHEVTVKEPVVIEVTTTQIKVVSAVIVNDRSETSGDILAGDGAIYRVTLTIPSGYNDFAIEMTGNLAKSESLL